MNKAIFFIPLVVGWSCFAENEAVPLTSPASGGNNGAEQAAQGLSLAGAPEATKSILQSMIPKVLIKESTIPEVARYFERESKRLDSGHAGVKIVTLMPQDFGLSNATSAHVISYSEKNIVFAVALLNTARLFNMKVEIHKDIYIMPVFADFKEWETRQGSTTPAPR